MANMSYCAFENTYLEVSQCVDLAEEVIDGSFKLSESEEVYANRIVDKMAQLKELLEIIEGIRTGKIEAPTPEMY